MSITPHTKQFYLPKHQKSSLKQIGNSQNLKPGVFVPNLASSEALTKDDCKATTTTKSKRKAKKSSGKALQTNPKCESSSSSVAVKKGTRRKSPAHDSKSAAKPAKRPKKIAITVPASPTFIVQSFDRYDKGSDKVLVRWKDYSERSWEHLAGLKEDF